MGKQRSPAARSENTYAVKGVSKETLDKFITAGLMVRSGEKGDPFYKFALDPIAEQLDANRLVIDIRENRADQTEIGDLIDQWEGLPQDFVSALRRAATSYRREIEAAHNTLFYRLWPETPVINGELNGRTVERVEPALQVLAEPAQRGTEVLIYSGNAWYTQTRIAKGSMTTKCWIGDERYTKAGDCFRIIALTRDDPLILGSKHTSLPNYRTKSGEVTVKRA